MIVTTSNKKQANLIAPSDGRMKKTLPDWLTGFIQYKKPAERKSGY